MSRTFRPEWTAILRQVVPASAVLVAVLLWSPPLLVRIADYVGWVITAGLLSMPLVFRVEVAEDSVRWSAYGRSYTYRRGSTRIRESEARSAVVTSRWLRLESVDGSARTNVVPLNVYRPRTRAELVRAVHSALIE